jgi:hypothetical protein
LRHMKRDMHAIIDVQNNPSSAWPTSDAPSRGVDVACLGPRATVPPRLRHCVSSEWYWSWPWGPSGRRWPCPTTRGAAPTDRICSRVRSQLVSEMDGWAGAIDSVGVHTDRAQDRFTSVYIGLRLCFPLPSHFVYRAIYIPWATQQ